MTLVVKLVRTVPSAKFIFTTKWEQITIICTLTLLRNPYFTIRVSKSRE